MPEFRKVRLAIKPSGDKNAGQLAMHTFEFTVAKAIIDLGNKVGAHPVDAAHILQAISDTLGFRGYDGVKKQWEEGVEQDHSMIYPEELKKLPEIRPDLPKGGSPGDMLLGVLQSIKEMNGADNGMDSRPATDPLQIN